MGHSTSPICARVQTRRTGRRKPHRLYYTDPRLMMTRMAPALLIALACLPAVSRAECPHGGMLGIGKCCCTCQGKACECWTTKCKEGCDACKCTPPGSHSKGGSQCINPGCNDWKPHVHGVWKCSNPRCEKRVNAPRIQEGRRFHGECSKKCGGRGCYNKNGKCCRCKAPWVRETYRNSCGYPADKTSYGECDCGRICYWHSKKCWDMTEYVIGGMCDDKCRCKCNRCLKRSENNPNDHSYPRLPPCPDCKGRGWVCNKSADKGTGRCKGNDTKHTKKWHRDCPKGCSRRRLADAFPDCSVCEGSGKTRSWLLRQSCENCFGIGKVRD